MGKLDTEGFEIDRFQLLGNTVAVSLLIVLILFTVIFSESHVSLGKVLNLSEVLQSRIYHNQQVASNLRRHLGYGGMIHNFKNFLLRGEKKYLDQAINNIELAKKDLNKFKNLDFSSEAIMEMINLEKVIQQYEKKLNEVRRLRLQGLSLQAIDKKVVVNDLPAIQALEKIDIILNDERQTFSQKYDGQLRAIRGIFYVVLPVLFIVIFASVFFVVWFTRKSILASKIYSEKYLKESNTYLQSEVAKQTKELKTLNERFELALTGTKDGIWDWDLITNQVYFSSQYKKMLGYEDEEFTNDPSEWEKRIHPEDLEMVNQEVSRHLEDSTYPYEVIFRMMHKDGSYRYILTRGNAIRDDQGRLHRFVGGHTDITPLKEAEKTIQEQKELMNLIIENLPVGIFAKDVTNNYRYVMWNKMLESIFGARREDVLGQDDRDLFSKKFGKEVRQIDKSVMKMGKKLDIPHEELITWKSENLVAHTIKIPIYDENKKPRLLLGIVEDITEKKGLIEELESHRNNLDELLRKRSAELVLAKEEAEKASRSKSEFLANMSHELRTPMHAIINFNQMAQMALERESYDKITKCFTRIDASAKRLLNLLNDLLDLSKYEAGKTEVILVKENILSCVEQSIDELRSLLEEKRLTVDVVTKIENPELAFDRVRVVQVIINILSNAIKVSPPNKVIKIEIKNSTKKIKGVEISVSDQGPGIPEGELETIFDKFVQSTQTNTGAGGTGLGLAICKEIIESHQGVIYAKNKAKGAGAVFSFVLPIGLDEK